MRPSNGFSLPELMIVLSTIGLILSTAAPHASGQLARVRTGLATKEFTSAHARAQATAVRFGRRTELHVNASARTFWIEVETDTPGATDTISDVRTLPSHLRMSSSRELLCFDSRGLATAAGACQEGNATILFDVNGTVDTVRFSVLGRVLR